MPTLYNELYKTMFLRTVLKIRPTVCIYNTMIRWCLVYPRSTCLSAARWRHYRILGLKIRSNLFFRHSLATWCSNEDDVWQGRARRRQPCLRNFTPGRWGTWMWEPSKLKKGNV